MAAFPRICGVCCLAVVLSPYCRQISCSWLVLPQARTCRIRYARPSSLKRLDLNASCSCFRAVARSGCAWTSKPQEWSCTGAPRPDACERSSPPRSLLNFACHRLRNAHPLRAIVLHCRRAARCAKSTFGVHDVTSNPSEYLPPCISEATLPPPPPHSFKKILVDIAC